METNQHLFKELEAAEKLFSDGSIKNAQKVLRNVLKESKTLDKIPNKFCLLYTSPSPRDQEASRMPSSA